MITKEDVGKLVVMVRDPTNKEWEEMGKVRIPLHIPIRLKSLHYIHPEMHVLLDDEEWYHCYPACCFELYNKTSDYLIFN